MREGKIGIAGRVKEMVSWKEGGKEIGGAREG